MRARNTGAGKKRCASPASAAGDSTLGDTGLDTLRGAALFSSLTDAELRLIREQVVLRNFRKNQSILREAETGSFMYVVLQGKVKASRTGRDGKETILAVHGAGEFFGELSLIDGKTAPADVVAVEDSRMAIISKAGFHALLLGQRKILDNLLTILCSRLREAWQKIEMLNFSDAPPRLRSLLTALANTHGDRTPAGTVLNVSLTHQDLADLAGLSRETVTRVLDRWRRSGQIETLPGKRLRLAPGFDPP